MKDDLNKENYARYLLAYAAATSHTPLSVAPTPGAASVWADVKDPLAHAPWVALGAWDGTKHENRGPRTLPEIEGEVARLLAVPPPEPPPKLWEPPASAAPVPPNFEADPG